MNIFQQLAKKDIVAFRAARKGLYKKNREFTDKFEQVAAYTEEERNQGSPVTAWRNRNFFAALYLQDEQPRLTVNRTTLDATGDWDGDITWDELMAVKRGIGMEDGWMVEVYPPDDECVNVANMRHLWLVHQPAFAWVREQKSPPAKPKSFFSKLSGFFWKGVKA